MAFQKSADDFKGAILSNTYLKLKYFHVNDKVVETNVLDNDGKLTYDENGKTIKEIKKVSNLRAAVWRYANKVMADNDVNGKSRIGQAIIVNWTDKGELINSKDKVIKKQIYELLGAETFFADCMNILEDE